MKILIRATNWVGDAIMALPALRAVQSRFPEAKIAILARPFIADLYRGQGIADELVSYDWRGAHQGIAGKEKLAQELRAKRFDVALMLQNAFDAAWIAWRAGIPERIGYNRDGRGILLTKRVGVPKKGEIRAHEKFYYLELLRRIGWLDTLPDIAEIRLRVGEEECGRAAETLHKAGVRREAIKIAVGAGASYGSAKCWPPERFAEALNLLSQQVEADVILFGTATEALVSAAIAERLRKNPIDLTGKTPMSDLPALLSQCHLFLGNDSGAMHVAAAVGLPVVAVFGPTDPEGTAPVTPWHTIVQQKPYCSPCFLRRCPTDHRCMTAIDPVIVENALRMQLREVHPA